MIGDIDVWCLMAYQHLKSIADSLCQVHSSMDVLSHFSVGLNYRIHIIPMNNSSAHTHTHTHTHMHAHAHVQLQVTYSLIPRS